MHRKLERVLIVEDNDALRAAMARVVRSWGAQAIEAGTVREAKTHLRPPPDLVVVDVRLPDGTAFSVLEAISGVWPAPVKVAISGKASPEEAFRLAQQGVRAYLSKPLSLGDLRAAVEAACREAPLIEPLVAESVGYVPMRELQRRVRSAMIHQALALNQGSRSGAARLLDVSRQALQQILRAAPVGAQGPAPKGDSAGPTPR